MKQKPKFSKSKCLKCKYHIRKTGGFAGRDKTGTWTSCMCNYAGITDHTCLTKENGKVVDRRGDDYKNCKLFEEGRPERMKVPDIALGGQR